MTTTDAQIEIGMPLEEYLERTTSEGWFEIINGREIAFLPNVAGHNWTGKQLFQYLAVFLARAALDDQVLYETPYVVEAKPNWVKGSRIPDLVMISGARWKAYIEQVPDWKRQPLMIVPDLAVEIISLNDMTRDVISKAHTMLDDGVQVVWLIDPDGQTVTIMPRNGIAILLHQNGDTLTGGDLLPGFSVTLAELFA